MDVSIDQVSKMLSDPAYNKGEAWIEDRVTELLGANARAAWPGIEKNISGPAAKVYCNGSQLQWGK